MQFRGDLSATRRLTVGLAINVPGWITGKDYLVNDLFIHGGDLYLVIANHTSSASPEADSASLNRFDLTDDVVYLGPGVQSQSGRINSYATAADIGAAPAVFPNSTYATFDRTTGELITYVANALGAAWQQVAVAASVTVTRLSSTQTGLAPGVYDLDSSGATFSIELEDTVGEWEFHNTNMSLGTNPVVLLSGGVKTFTDANGTQVLADFNLDVGGVAVTVLHTELGSVYRISLQRGDVPNNRAFAPNTAVAPVTAGNPTTAEISVWAGTLTDTIVYYTGTDIAADSPTVVFHIDAVGSVTRIGNLASLRSPDTQTYTEVVDGQINFVVDGNAVGSVVYDTLLGMPKWTLSGGLDPTYFQLTPVTTIQRDALVAASPSLKKGWMVFHVDVGVERYEVWNGTVWSPLGGGSANDHLFADVTTVNPAVLATPTLAEIATFAGTRRDRIIYFTGSDTSTDAPTYVYHIDQAGDVKLLKAPAAGSWNLHFAVAPFTPNVNYVLLAAGTYDMPTGAAAGDVIELIASTAGCLLENTTGDLYSAPGQLIEPFELPIYLKVTVFNVGSNNWSVIKQFDSRVDFTDTASGVLGDTSNYLANVWRVNQTTASQALTFPVTAAPETYVIYVQNIGSASFTIEGVTVDVGTVVGMLWNGTVWSPLGGGEGNARYFLSDTVAGPAISGAPTVAEVTAAIGTLVDTIIYYTGNDTSTDPVTYVFHVDQLGAVTLLHSPSVASASISPWAVSTAYTLNQYVEQGTKFYRCVLAHTSSALFATDSANWVEVSPSDPLATLLDSSGGAVIETLPAATGSGATRKYAIKDKTNSITFAVQAGDYLNEVLNDTYLASNHGKGTEFELVDYAADRWSLGIVGTPTESTLVRYSVRGVAANISTVNGPNILPIGSLVNSDLVSSGLLVSGELDPFGMRTANQVTVPKTGTYRVDVLVVHTAANLQGADAQTASGSSRSGIRINGTLIEWTGIDDTAGLADQTIGFIVRQFTAGDEIDVVVNATSVEVNEDYYVSFAMEELPTSEVILAGNIVPTPLAKAFLSEYGSAIQSVPTFSQTDYSILLPNTHRIDLTTATQSNISGLTLQSNNNRVRIDSAGNYRVSASILYNPSALGENTFMQIVKNGTTVLALSNTSNNSNSSQGETIDIDWEGDLVATDTIDIRISEDDGTPASFSLNGYRLSIRQQPSSTVVNPDTLPVTDIHSFSITSQENQNIDSILTAVGSGYAVMSFTDVNRLNFHNPDSIGVAASNYVQIAQAGTYEMIASASDAGGYDYKIRVNGVTVAGLDDVGVSAGVMLHAIKTLSVGDKVEFDVGTTASASAITGGCFSVKQLPTSSVVKYTPGDVVVEDLAFFSISPITDSGTTDATSTSGFMLLDGSGTGATNSRVYNPSGMRTSSTELTLPTTGEYEVSLGFRNVTGNEQIRVLLDGSERIRCYSQSGTNHNAGFATGIFSAVAGQKLTFAVTQQTVSVENFSLSVKQLPTGVFVDPGTVTAEDLHYASIYGDMQSNVTAANGQTNVYNFAGGTVGSNVGSMINVAGNQIAIQQSGTYRLFLTAFDGTDACNPTIVKNASAIVASSQFSAGDVKYPGVIDVIVPLVAGDILTFKDAYVTTTNQRGVRITVQQLPAHTIIAYTPGDVVATALAFGQVTITDGQTTTSTGAWVDVTGGSVTLPNIGTYNVDYSVSSNNNTVGQATLFRLVKTSDSSEVDNSYSTVAEASGAGNQGANTVPLRITTTTASEAYKLQWRVSGGTGTLFHNATLTGAGGRSSIRYTQLPTHEVVSPGDVPVEPLVFCHVRANATQTITADTDTVIQLGAVISDASSMFVDAADRIVVPTTGRYRIRGKIPYGASGNTEPQTAKLRINGTTIIGLGSTRNNVTFATAEVDVVVSLNALDYIELIANQSSDGSLATVITTSGQFTGAWAELEVTQLSMYSVIDPDVIPVNDQAASGYIDIGNVRQMWGRFTTANATTQTVTLPAAFANTNYSVVMSPNANGFAIMASDVVNASTTTFTFINRNAGGGANTSAGFGFNWIAMGLKP